MSASLRPCRACGRHARTDETTCPFCGADLGIFHAMPIVAMGDERPAPKYGGPPWRSPVTLSALLILLLGGVGALWLLMMQR